MAIKNNKKKYKKIFNNANIFSKLKKLYNIQQIKKMKK